MAIREIIEIDEAACDGCGACETGCPEGALRVIDGKARLVGESLCDGLGACIGNCPRGAIRISRREAEDYNEARVIEGIVRLGPKVLRAHLGHLEHHGQDAYLREARKYLAERGIELPAPEAGCASSQSGCASSQSGGASSRSGCASALRHWPIQLHLINPRAPQFAGARLLVAADCTAFALGSFHASLLEGRSLVIACPKLDQGREVYVEKLALLVEGAASVEVAIMEVPCCSGLVKLVLESRERCAKKPAILARIAGIEGGIIGEKSF